MKGLAFAALACSSRADHTLDPHASAGDAGTGRTDRHRDNELRAGAANRGSGGDRSDAVHDDDLNLVDLN